jgi:hypothetical protein
MPVTVDWGTKVISVPQSYLTFVSGTLYEMDTDQFRLDLKELEASQAGMPFLDTHQHNTEVTIAGDIYARLIEIINGYTVTFEDGQYAVKLVGSNNNIFDEGIINRNQVSIIPTNSAGLIREPGGPPPTAAEVAAAVWDEILTGATHNINQSAGKILRGLGNLVVHTDTAQGAGTGNNQIQLANAASAVDGEYDPSVVAIVDGTGAGQSRLILQYDGATRTATVDRNWKVNPDATSEYVIYADAGREHVNEGLAQGGSTNTITLNTLASSIDDVYLHQTIFIRSGTGEDQVGIVVAYNGTTKVATIDGTWAVIPDTTSAYVMLPYHNNVATEQFVAYSGHITIDAANGVAGTAYPVGTGLTPVNNLADAKTLGLAFGIETFRVEGTLIIGASDVVDGLVFEGSNELQDVIILTPGCSTVNTVFRDMTITGTPNGGVFAQRCAMSAVLLIGSDDDPSLFFECILIESTFSFRAGLTTPQNIQFVDCVAGVDSGTGTILDFNSTTSRVAMRKWSGNARFQNYTGGQALVLDCDHGDLTFDASCTTGTAIVRGVAEIADSSGPGFTIVTTAAVGPPGIAAAVWGEDLTTYTTDDEAGNVLYSAWNLIQALLGLKG